jgi:eukaryotic-like serine/threonine-protein kinase
MSASVSRIPEGSIEETRDLQDRIGRFARMTFVISGVMLLAAASGDILNGRAYEGISNTGRVVHVSVEVLLFVVWWLCRGRARSLSLLQTLDAALTIVLCTGWALLGVRAPATEAIEFSILLATTYTLIVRSVIVPSTFQRTLAVSAPSIVPTVVFFFVRGAPFLADRRAETHQRFLLFSVLWCLVSMFTAALNSRQLYGLRQRIREVHRLGQYTLEEKIGEGGMGVVYRATHAMLRRPAAIKLLLPERAGEKDLARFEREVQLTSRLSHPNTISIFDYGRSAEGVFYYVMEFLDGFDLERVVESEGPLPAARAIRILVQASGALAEAHALGLIHRDIKPANIILTERADEPDVVKVVDFGLVKTLQNSPGELQVTNVDAITGTPMYLAPEAIAAPDSMDGRADLYALGAVGYFLISGQHVFDAANVVEMCSKHLLDIPVPPSRRVDARVPPDFEALVMSCLEKSPDARPQSAEALRDALLACVDAGRYDLAEGRAWWRERGATLRARPSKPHTDRQAVTLAIDLSGRASVASRA